MSGPSMFRSVESFDWTDEYVVVGRVFPFGQRARVADPLPDGSLDIYDEEFVPGCTANMRQGIRAASFPKWMRFTLDHLADMGHRTGYCRALDERGDGVYAELELYDGDHRDKYRSMMRTSHTGLSIEFVDTTRNPPSGEHRLRRQIHIEAITATPIPAYAGAQILSVRSEALLPGATPNLDAVRAMLAGPAAVTPPA